MPSDLTGQRFTRPEGVVLRESMFVIVEHNFKSGDLKP